MGYSSSDASAAVAFMAASLASISAILRAASCLASSKYLKERLNKVHVDGNLDASILPTPRGNTQLVISYTLAGISIVFIEIPWQLYFFKGNVVPLF